MFSMSLILLQARGASWLVWTVVIILFVIGVSMIVFFSRRLRKGEQEPEDWTLAQRSLITLSEPSNQVTEDLPEEVEAPGEEVAASIRQPETEAQESQRVEAVIEPADHREQSSDQESIRHTQAFASITEPREELPVDTQMFSAVEEPPASRTEILSSTTERDEPPALPPLAEPVRETRETEMLASPQPEPSEQVAETTPFGDEIWSEIESRLQPSAPPSESAEVETTMQAEEPAIETEAVAESASEIDYTARVEERAAVEPLIVGSGNRREPFEPPTITPLESREHHPAARQTQPAIRQTAFTPAPRNVPAESKLPPETRVEQPAPQIEEAPAEAAPIEAAEPAAAMPKATPRTVSGAVLGLPVDYSDKPMILGTPVRRPEEEGIGSLTSYGKSMDQEGSRWGTITLGVLVLLIAGSIAAYFYSPWFKAKFDGLLASVGNSFRGGSAPAPKPELPRAQIYPRRGEPDKNMVKARGAVINITEEPLTGLAVEVELTLNDGSREPRTLAVEPNQLAPSQQGIYEFEYDGKLYTGYSVSKLLSDGTEIKYIIPGRR